MKMNLDDKVIRHGAVGDHCVDGHCYHLQVLLNGEGYGHAVCIARIEDKTECNVWRMVHEVDEEEFDSPWDYWED